MAQYSNLKAYIEEKIYENGTQAITGDILQDVLKVMTDDLGEFYQTGGVASPSTDPGTPDAKVIYFATEAGTYTNFGGITLAAGEVALLIFETSWTKVELNVLSSANGGVKTANLADGAVTTGKIAGGAVETAKIADNAVTSGKVADGAIGTAKIADGAIDADKIAANAVESAKIKNGAVTEGKINDGAVTADKVAANAVTTSKIADDAVTTAKLNDGAVTEDKIATDAVTSGKVKDGAIGTAKIAAGAVTHAKIGAGAVEESNIKDGAVTSDKIANGAVGSDQLAEGAFSAENLADGSVTTDKLADNAVTAEKIADGAVTAGKFANGSVTTIKLGSGAVTTEKIGDGMVTRQKLADSSVGTSKIIDGAVTTDKVADGAITDAKLENPVSVSQNTETGKTSVQVGGTDAVYLANSANVEALGVHTSILRQGTQTNAENTTNVCCKNIIARGSISSIRCFTTKPLPANCEWHWRFEGFSESEGVTLGKTNIQQQVGTSNEFILNSNVNGFMFTISCYNKTTTSYETISPSDFENEIVYAISDNGVIAISLYDVYHNRYVNLTAETYYFSNKQTARNAVNNPYRIKGVRIVYTLMISDASLEVVTEEFKGDDWSSDSNWELIDSISIQSNKKYKSIGIGVQSGELRQGTPTNQSSTTGICHKYIQKRESDTVKFVVNKPAPSGCEWRYRIDFFSTDFGTSAQTLRTRTIADLSVGEASFQSGEKGYAITVGVVNTSTSQAQSITPSDIEPQELLCIIPNSAFDKAFRTTKDNASGKLTTRNIYNESNEVSPYETTKLMGFVFPLMRNGTQNNPDNQKAIVSTYVIARDGADDFFFGTNKPAPDGCRWEYRIDYFAETSGASYALTRTRYEFNAKKVHFQSGENSFSLGVGCVEISTGNAIDLSVDDFEGYFVFAINGNGKGVDGMLELGTNVVFVGKGSNYKYNDVKDAIEAITDDSENNNYLILVDKGVYSPIHLTSTRHISIVGVSRDDCILLDTTGVYSMTNTIQSTGYYANLTFISNHDYWGSDQVYLEKLISGEVQRAYAMHTEAGSNTSLTFYNCVFKSANTVAVGAGLHYNEWLRFICCEFHDIRPSILTAIDSRGCFFCHSDVLNSTGQRLLLDSCTFYAGNNGVSVLALGNAGGGSGKFYFWNNKVVKGNYKIVDDLCNLHYGTNGTQIFDLSWFDESCGGNDVDVMNYYRKSASTRPDGVRLAVGFNFFDTSINKPVWLKNKKQYPSAMLTFSTVISSTGTINVKVGDVDVDLVVTQDDVDMIDGNMRNNIRWLRSKLTQAGVIVFDAEPRLEVYANSYAVISSSDISYSAGTTGCNATISVEKEGCTANVWVDATGASV